MELAKAHLHYRVSSYKGKEYRSYSVARAIRKNGKNTREILLKLGKLSDEEARQWKIALSVLKAGESSVTSLDDVITEANYAYLDVAVLLEVWHSWGLSKIFANNGEREVPLWAVVAALTINRCIAPSSKSQASSWFRKTALPFILKIDPAQMNPSRIFRELTTIDHLKSDLCDYLYQEITRRDPLSMEEVFYDLSSTTFSGTKCLLMDWGFCKEGFENHIVLALVVNKKGLPIYWQVLSGCTTDVTTIEWLLGSLKDRFKIAKPTMVFDRGMVSDGNLSLLEQDQIKYISAMDRNQLKSLADIDFSDFVGKTSEEVVRAIIASEKFTKLNETTYYHEVKLCEGGGRRYILCFNPQLCDDQRNARKQAVSRFESTVRAINRELLEAKNSREEESTLNKFKCEMSIEQKGYLEVVLRQKKLEFETEKGRTKMVRTYQGKVVIDEKKMINAGQLDGFWMIVTNHTESDRDNGFKMSAEEVIKPYKDKVMIESSFRDIKSFLEISPVHVWTIEHVKAHYTICVLAYLLDRTLSLRLHEKPGVCSKDVVAHPKLYEELGKCLLNRYKIKGTLKETVGLTRPTDEQKELLERIGLTHLLQEEIAKKYFAEFANYV